MLSVFLEKVKLFGHRTIYNKYGDWIVYFAIFVLLVRFSVLGKKYLSNRKTKNEPIENFENNPEKSFDWESNENNTNTYNVCFWNICNWYFEFWKSI